MCTAGIERCRRSWEVICANEKIYGLSTARNQGNTAGVEYIRNYRLRVEGEIRAACEDALRLVDKFILPQLDSQHGNRSFSKMKADLAKFQDGFEPSTTPAAGGGLDAGLDAELLRIPGAGRLVRKVEWRGPILLGHHRFLRHPIAAENRRGADAPLSPPP